MGGFQPWTYVDFGVLVVARLRVWSVNQALNINYGGGYVDGIKEDFLGTQMVIFEKTASTAKTGPNLPAEFQIPGGFRRDERSNRFCSVLEPGFRVSYFRMSTLLRCYPFYASP